MLLHIKRVLCISILFSSIRIYADDFNQLQTLSNLVKSDILSLNGTFLSPFSIDDIFEGDSKSCKAFKNVFLGDFTDLKDQNIIWLIKMFDAWSKLPSGIMLKNLIDYGNFDECMAINEDFAGTNVKGQYCAYSLNVIFGKDFIINLSTCLPDSCTLKDGLIGNIAISKKMCQTESDSNISLEWDDWVVIAVSYFLVYVIVCSTVYDIYLHMTGNPPSHLLTVAFSLLTNGRKLFAVSNSSKQVGCLNGIRTISLMWIIAGHRFVSLTALGLTNKYDAEKFKGDIASSYISSARAAVDTFFFLSAFLLSYNYFKGIQSAIIKAESKGSQDVQNPLTLFKIPLFYIHRLLRITPALAAVYFAQITIVRRIPRGPLAVMSDLMVKPCYDWWWSFFLYIQNYVNYHEMCIVPTWYLSADMQLFLLSPLVIIPLGTLIIRRKKMLAYIFIGVVVICCIFIPMIPDFFRKFDPENIYETHPRLSVYTMGILFGMIVVEFSGKKIEIPQIVNIALWVLSLAVMLTILLTMHDTEAHGEQLKNNMFFTFSRPVWSLGLSWIIFACHFQYGGPVNWFLSKSIFQIMTRLSFSMYLLHNLVITVALLNAKTTLHFSEFETIYLWCGDYIFTVLISIVWVLCFESPIVTIEKVIFSSGRTKPETTTQTNPTARNSHKH